MQSDGAGKFAGRNFIRIIACLLCSVIALENIPTLAASLKELQKKAQKGNAQAQFELGMMYYDGNGTDKSDSEAFKWYKRAEGMDVAENASVWGMFILIGKNIARLTQNVCKMDGRGRALDNIFDGRL